MNLTNILKTLGCLLLVTISYASDLGKGCIDLKNTYISFAGSDDYFPTCQTNENGEVEYM